MRAISSIGSPNDSSVRSADRRKTFSRKSFFFICQKMNNYALIARYVSMFFDTLSDTIDEMNFDELCYINKFRVQLGIRAMRFDELIFVAQCLRWHQLVDVEEGAVNPIIPTVDNVFGQNCMKN